MRPKLSTPVETPVSRPVLPFPIIDCPFKGPILVLDVQVCVRETSVTCLNEHV